MVPMTHEDKKKRHVEADNTHLAPTELVSDAVIHATADECDPIDLPPLYEAIDPEALNALYTRSSPTVQSSMQATTSQFHPMN